MCIKWNEAVMTCQLNASDATRLAQHGCPVGDPSDSKFNTDLRVTFGTVMAGSTWGHNGSPEAEG